jgi:adenosylmethionine-8-amino-7-oxononanoate aminotransferase
MKKVCERHGALLILDEVMCGTGRTGTFHAWEQEGIVPDIQVLGKGLGSGYGAISAVLLKDWVVKSLQQGGKMFAHGQTYMTHPLAAAAAFKAQQVLKKEGLVENVREMGNYFERKLKERFSVHPHVGDIRGRGLFWTIEFVADKETKAAFPSDIGLATKLHSRGLSKGYEISLFNANGSMDGYAGDHILLAPPYIVDEADINEIVDRLGRVIDDTFAMLK